jgi:hypothetical protein
MPNRIAKFISAIVAGLCAGIPLTVSQGATPAPAADECLLAPKGETPEGSHWYYRIEHPSNRHCWYLRAEGGAPAQAAASTAPTPAKPPAPKAETSMPGSVANARAELTTRVPLDQGAAVNTGQVPAAGSAPVIDSTPPTPAADANMPTSVVASRWPEQLAANAVAAPPPPAAAVPPADVQTNVPPPPAVAPPVAPLATADAAMTKQSGSFVMLLAVIVGALSVAGLVASMVFRSGSKRRKPPLTLEQVRPVWDLDRELKRRRAPSPFPTAAVTRPSIGLPLELQEAQQAHREQEAYRETDEFDDRDRIAQMLSRLAKSAQA